MTLTTRLLPPDEWEKLRAIEPYKSKGLPGEPDDWRILVIEREGELVGTCALFTAVHWDNWWIAPKLRGTGGVLGALLRASVQLLAMAEIEQVYTGAARGDAEVEELLQHFGFAPAGGRLFVLEVAEATKKIRPKEARDGVAQ